MQITAAMFTDPSMRPKLEQYYRQKSEEAFRAWKSRDESSVPTELSMRTPDGDVVTLKAIPISAEKMRGALVDFDTWAKLQADAFANSGFGPATTETAPEPPASGTGSSSSGHEDQTTRQRQWQAALDEIQRFMMSFQEAA